MDWLQMMTHTHTTYYIFFYLTLNDPAPFRRIKISLNSVSSVLWILSGYAVYTWVLAYTEFL